MPFKTGAAAVVLSAGMLMALESKLCCGDLKPHDRRACARNRKNRKNVNVQLLFYPKGNGDFKQ
jgi:hypothetical protein